MKGENLKRRIGEAIATCQSKLTALEDRIKALSPARGTLFMVVPPRVE